jgi:putative ABC transport system substrate-binding protein
MKRRQFITLLGGAAAAWPLVARAQQPATPVRAVNRRSFITLLGGATAAWPFAARAQQRGTPVVGFLHVESSDGLVHIVEAFRRGLADSDFVEGRNVAVEYRWAEGQLNRLPELVSDLLQKQVAVIVGAARAVQTVKEVTSTVPVVFVAAQDPIKFGLVESFNRPGGNLTGVYIVTSGLEAKRLGLLRDVVPAATTVAVLIDPNFTTAEAQLRDVQIAAVRLGMQLVVVSVTSEGDFEKAFSTFVHQRAAGLLVSASPFLNSKRDQIAALASRYKLPSISEWREFPSAGGLMSYGNSLTDAWSKVGLYAGRILKGAKPIDLPVLQPTKFELVINLKTAKELGLTISANFLTLADEVIE